MPFHDTQGVVWRLRCSYKWCRATRFNYGSGSLSCPGSVFLFVNTVLKPQRGEKVWSPCLGRPKKLTTQPVTDSRGTRGNPASGKC